MSLFLLLAYDSVVLPLSLGHLHGSVLVVCDSDVLVEFLDPQNLVVQFPVLFFLLFGPHDGLEFPVVRSWVVFKIVRLEELLPERVAVLVQDVLVLLSGAFLLNAEFDHFVEVLRQVDELVAFFVVDGLHLVHEALEVVLNFILELVELFQLPKNLWVRA